jgi:putative oxidoreductase
MEREEDMKRFFQTDASWHRLILRVFLGGVMFPHGAQKLFGWFGGYGFTATLSTFTDKMHIPAFLAFIVIILESLGSLGLIAGFMTRLIALGFLIFMIVAIRMVHWPNGFFINWFGQQKGEGFEYHLLVIGISLALLIGGGGKASMDALIAGKEE